MSFVFVCQRFPFHLIYNVIPVSIILANRVDELQIDRKTFSMSSQSKNQEIYKYTFRLVVRKEI